VDIHTTPVGWKVIGAAIEIHRALGPGLLESAYDGALAQEFATRGLRFVRQVPVHTRYEDRPVGAPYRVDFVVQEELVVELKAVFQPAAIHRSQLRTYLRFLGLRQGLLLNFSYPRMVDGLISVLLPIRPTPASRP
jgi:GxxExxY protein